MLHEMGGTTTGLGMGVMETLHGCHMKRPPPPQTYENMRAKYHPPGGATNFEFDDLKLFSGFRRVQDFWLPVSSGKLQVESGKWQVESGKWNVASASVCARECADI